MPVHPQAQAILDLVYSVERPAPSDETLQAARDGMHLLHLAGAGPLTEVHSVTDHDAGGVRVRAYHPRAGSRLPVLVWFHGGGWTLGCLDEYDAVCRALAAAADALVVSVGYALAPEQPFPAGLDDCRRALHWVTDHAESLGGDATRVAVGGDSAGGNIAAAVALLARDEGPELALQVLVYPALDAAMDTASWAANGEGYLLEAAQTRWFWSNYTRGGTDPADWRVSPLRAPDLAGVAPAVVVTAEFDPLRDEGESYAQRLADANVPVVARRFDGMIHIFFSMPGAFDAAREAIALVGSELQRVFGSVRR
jgi:acetyl esterase